MVKKHEIIRLVDDKAKWFKEDQVEPQNPPKYELLEGEYLKLSKFVVLRAKDLGPHPKNFKIFLDPDLFRPPVI